MWNKISVNFPANEESRRKTLKSESSPNAEPKKIDLSERHACPGTDFYIYFIIEEKKEQGEKQSIKPKSVGNAMSVWQIVNLVWLGRAQMEITKHITIYRLYLTRHATHRVEPIAFFFFFSSSSKALL